MFHRTTQQKFARAYFPVAALRKTLTAMKGLAAVMDSSLNPHNSRMAWPIAVIHISLINIFKVFSYEGNLYFDCSSPLIKT